LTGHALLDAGALALRGKSDRTSVCAVIGDGQVAASQEFAKLQASHARLVEALRSRSASSRKLASAAKFTAARLPVGLQEFYDRIWRRAGHFATDESGNGQLRQAADWNGSG
jgi:adenylate cyclase